MKKIVFLPFCLAILCLLVSCGGNSTKDKLVGNWKFSNNIWDAESEATIIFSGVINLQADGTYTIKSDGETSIIFKGVDADFTPTVHLSYEEAGIWDVNDNELILSPKRSGRLLGFTDVYVVGKDDLQVYEFTDNEKKKTVQGWALGCFVNFINENVRNERILTAGQDKFATNSSLGISQHNVLYERVN